MDSAPHSAIQMEKIPEDSPLQSDLAGCYTRRNDTFMEEPKPKPRSSTLPLDSSRNNSATSLAQTKSASSLLQLTRQMSSKTETSLSVPVGKINISPKIIPLTLKPRSSTLPLDSSRNNSATSLAQTKSASSLLQLTRQMSSKTETSLSVPVGKINISPKIIPLTLMKMKLESRACDDDQEENIVRVIRKKSTRQSQCHGDQKAVPASSKRDWFLWLNEPSIVKAVEEHHKASGDKFMEEVETKTKTLGIGKLEAIFEAYTDLIVEKAGKSENQALLWVLDQKEYTELCMEVFVIRLLDRGANVNIFADDTENTLLHLAAKIGYITIGRRLIAEAGALIDEKNKAGEIPLKLSIDGKHNDFSVMLIKKMEPRSVRRMFRKKKRCQDSSPDDTSQLVSMHDFLDNSSMKGTVLAVLDTMMEPMPDMPGESNTFLIHYAVLDGDRHGSTPKAPNFCTPEKTCLHKIAYSQDKDFAYHDVVRFLLRKKWKEFVRVILILQFLHYLLLVTALTCALVLAAKKPDPRLYDTPVDIFRGICEGLAIIAVGYNGLSELNQVRIHKQLYFKEYFNYLDIPSLFFFFMIIPFRAAGLNVQWVFASLCYLFNGLRAINFAPVFKSTGAFVQILFQVLLKDIIQFGTIFIVFLLSFSGALYLALRGEERPVSELACGNITDFECDSNDTLVTSLNLNPFETAELYHVWFTGIRVMIEGTNVLGEYYGYNGFKWLGVIIYVVFLFLVIVVLLNLLIAQMSDTYSNVQKDAQRSLSLNRAWIVARVEHNSFIVWLFQCRKKHYKQCELEKNPKDVLEKWEVPPIKEVNRKLEGLESAITKQEDAMDDLRNSVMEKLEEILSKSQVSSETLPSAAPLQTQ